MRNKKSAERFSEYQKNISLRNPGEYEAISAAKEFIVDNLEVVRGSLNTYRDCDYYLLTFKLRPPQGIRCENKYFEIIQEHEIILNRPELPLIGQVELVHEKQKKLTSLLNCLEAIHRYKYDEKDGEANGRLLSTKIYDLV